MARMRERQVMPGFRHGAKRGLVIVTVGLVVAVLSAVLLPVVVEAGVVPAWVAPVAGGLAVAMMLLRVKASKYWSYRYMAGFAIGLALPLPFLLQTSFVGLRELLLYGGAAVAVVAFKLWIRW